MDINHIRATVQLIVGIALFKVASQVALWHTAPLFSQTAVLQLRLLEIPI